MDVAVSVFLIAVGAVLAFAVHGPTSHLSVNTIGFVLLAFGVVDAFLSIWSSRDGLARSRRAFADDAPRPAGAAKPSRTKSSSDERLRRLMLLAGDPVPVAIEVSRQRGLQRPRLQGV